MPGKATGKRLEYGVDGAPSRSRSMRVISPTSSNGCCLNERITIPVRINRPRATQVGRHGQQGLANSTRGIRLSTKGFQPREQIHSAAEKAIAVDGTENYGWNYPDSRALPGAAFLSDMVSRIPDESRLRTLTEAPNKERMRYATGGPSPRSPLGVSVSSTEKISKNFGRAVVEIVLP